jgi:hypothetical protein
VNGGAHARGLDARERDANTRDVFLDGLELPRGLELEIVTDGDHGYELNGDDSRTLATIGAFRAVAERDLRDHATTPTIGASLTSVICETKA